MESNTHSSRHPGGRPDGLAGLAAAVQEVVAQDLDGFPDTVRAERVLGWRRLLDRLEGQWPKELAALDAAGAAGADHGQQAGSTAAWLRNRLRLGAGAASSSLRTARALFRGPLPETAQALSDGELSPAHASVVAHGTHELPTTSAPRVLGQLRLVADPDGERDRAEVRHGRRGLWLAPTWEGMVALDGLLEAEAGQTLLAALEPLARPPTPSTPAAGPAPGRCPGRAGPAGAGGVGCPRAVGSGSSCW
jgi:Domain of unknown function (DUF222)